VPRTSFRERMSQEATPRGREALYAPATVSAGTAEPPLPLTVDGQPFSVMPATPRRVAGDRRWEAAHQRVTFYCPRDLLRILELEGARSERSKTQVIVDALRQHLNA
jgi:hypothetical protein